MMSSPKDQDMSLHQDQQQQQQHQLAFYKMSSPKDRDMPLHQDLQQQQQQQQHQHEHDQHINNLHKQCSFQSLIKKQNLMLINAQLTDEKLNQEEVMLVHAINSVGCKNYGLNADLVEKYPFCDFAGRRYCDSDLKCIAQECDRNPEGQCFVRSPPLYMKAPKVACLVTQFGIGKPYDENKLARKIVMNCTQESFVRHLRRDSSDNRLIYFNNALNSLSASLKNNAYPDTTKVILPIGIGCSVVSERWLCRYYELIKKFAREISQTGIHCYIAVRKNYLFAIDKFVNKRCTPKARAQLKELKSFPWKDVDEKWFNDLINKKEENILENVHRSNSTSSKCETSLHVITEDEVDNRESIGEHDNDDELDETVIYDDTLPW